MLNILGIVGFLALYLGGVWLFARMMTTAQAREGWKRGQDSSGGGY